MNNIRKVTLRIYHQGISDSWDYIVIIVT